MLRRPLVDDDMALMRTRRPRTRTTTRFSSLSLSICRRGVIFLVRREARQMRQQKMGGKWAAVIDVLFLFFFQWEETDVVHFRNAEKGKCGRGFFFLRPLILMTT